MLLCAAAVRIDEFKVMVAADGVHTDLQLEVSRSHVWLCYCCCFLFTTVYRESDPEKSRFILYFKNFISILVAPIKFFTHP